EQASATVASIQAAVQRQADSLKATLDDSSGHAREAAAVLGRQFAELTASIRQAVADGAEGLKSVSAEAAGHAANLVDTLARERAQRAETLAAAEADTAPLRTALRTQLDEISGVAARIAADTTGIGDSFKGHAATLQDAARAAGAEATNLRTILD